MYLNKPLAFFYFITLLLILYCKENFSQVLYQADSALDVGDYSMAIRLYQENLRSANIRTTLDSGNAYMRTGLCYFELNQKEDALRQYFMALAIFERINHTDRLAAVTNNIARVYWSLQDYENTEKYRLQSMSHYTNTNDSFHVAFLMNDLAILYNQTQKKEKALQLHTLALTHFKNAMNNYLLCRHLYNKGNCFPPGEVDSGLVYYSKAEIMAMQDKDSSMLSVIYNSIGEAYKQNRKFTKAVPYLKKSLICNKQAGSPEERIIICQNLAEVYFELKQFDKSFHLLQEERTLRENVYQGEKSRFAADISEKYESDKKDQKIKTQETESKLKSRNLLLSLGGLALAAALAVISFINYQRKQKANKILKAQKEKIEALNKDLDASNQVKTKLFSVISHDLRSPISSLYAYLQLKNNSNDEKDVAIIGQTEQLLETMEDLLIWSKSQLHQFEPATENIHLFQLLNNITTLLHANALQKNVEIVNEIPQDIHMVSDVNILTIILRNVISNAIKFSTTSSFIVIKANVLEQITILVTNQSNKENIQFLTSVTTEKVTSNKSGLGISLIKEFTAKLKGNFSYSVTENKVIASINLQK